LDEFSGIQHHSAMMEKAESVGRLGTGRALTAIEADVEFGVVESASNVPTQADR